MRRISTRRSSRRLPIWRQEPSGRHAIRPVWNLRAIDALFVCTCTGYLCPGVSSHLAEQTGVRPDAFLNDMTGLGCGAALPTLHAASCFLAAHPDATVATVAVEVCSAAFYLDDDAGVIVSACLFGDGASAALWRSADAGGQWKASNFRSLHRPEEREKIRFVNAGGRLKNQLHRTVPQVAAESVEVLFSLCSSKPDQVIAHAGGRDVIEAIEERLPEYSLAETREAFRKYGNSEQSLGPLRLGGAVVQGQWRQAPLADHIWRRIRRALLRIEPGLGLCSGHGFASQSSRRPTSLHCKASSLRGNLRHGS